MRQFISVLVHTVLILFSVQSYGQNSLILELDRPYFLQKLETVPENLTSSRCAVIYAVPNIAKSTFVRFGESSEFVRKIHNNFLKMQIDAIMYIQKGDFISSPDMLHKYLTLIKARNIANIIFMEQTGEANEVNYTLSVIPVSESGFISDNQLVWQEQSPEFDRVFLRMGRQILRQDLTRSSFLIPDKPEVVSEPKLYEGLRLENYPSHVKRATIGVIQFKKIDIPDQLSEEQSSVAFAYNDEIDKKNKELTALLDSIYPYKYHLIDFTSEADFYKEGYQFVLIPMVNSAKTIQKILSYKITGNETDFISIVPDPVTRNDRLKTLPAEALVYKYYIKQTVSFDIHVGKEWDADTTWQQALTNYILHLDSYLNR